MRKRRFLLTAVAGLLLAVAACAGGAPQSADRPADRPTGTPSAGASDVVAVRVVVSGGITGGREVLDARRDRVPDGITPARHARALALAGRLATRWARVDRDAGSPQCCDVRTVELRVEYADGTRARAALPETRLPAQLTRLVALLTSQLR